MTFQLDETDIVQRKDGWKECKNYPTVSVVLHVSLLKAGKDLKEKSVERVRHESLINEWRANCMTGIYNTENLSDSFAALRDTYCGGKD